MWLSFGFDVGFCKKKSRIVADMEVIRVISRCDSEGEAMRMCAGENDRSFDFSKEFSQRRIDLLKGTIRKKIDMAIEAGDLWKL